MSQTMSPDFITEWWERVRAGERLVQRCDACGHLQLHPRRRCNECGGSDVGFQGVSGYGTLYSFTTVNYNAPSDFIDQLPYTLAIVRLDEGPQMLSRLVDIENVDDLRCDQRVQWVMSEISGTQMPCFSLVDKAD